ncbi:MAG: Ig-like domain-containing protein, partial [Steroidobacteraceae bacterium]
MTADQAARVPTALATNPTKGVIQLMLNLLRAACLSLPLLVLAACGGGGGSDTPTPTPPNPSPPATVTYTIGGSVTGLAANTSLVLQNNGGSNLTVNANGAFTIATPVNSGAAYAVTILTQPAGQTCTLANASGTASANVTSVAVTCAATAATSRTIGGNVSGLAAGTAVVLRNNGGNDLSVAANGAFTFTTPVVSGATYAVTVQTQPTAPGPGQTCSITNGSGAVAGVNITNVTVTCANTDTTAPTVSARTPLPTSFGTRVQGPVVTVTFSEALNPATVTTTSLTLQGPGGAPVAGTVAMAAGNTQATFTPSAPLAFDAEYVATVTIGVRDVSGNALAAPVAWRFDTGKQLALGYWHGCIRTVDGRVKCWGDNRYGQLG